MVDVLADDYFSVKSFHLEILYVFRKLNLPLFIFRFFYCSVILALFYLLYRYGMLFNPSQSHGNQPRLFGNLSAMF